LFPRITRVVDVRAQATQALAELTASAGQGGDFLDLLAKAGEPLLAPATDQLSLASISFERGALELRVRAPDMPSIERYQQRLAQTALPVTTLSVEKRDDGAEASVRIGQLQ
jgi:type II secretory pathway component PulL